MKKFNIHWIINNKHRFLSVNSLDALPCVGDEIRQSDKEFYVVEKIVWCLDEYNDIHQQRVNIKLKKIKL